MQRHAEKGTKPERCVNMKWVGQSCGQHGSYQFFKAFSYHLNEQEHDRRSTDVGPQTKDKILAIKRRKRILAVGDFFFLRFHKDEPICIGEIHLLWTDKVTEQDLSSTRLYYIPETTPAGRTPQHGKDEVLAASEKVVVKVSELATLIVEPDEWDYGCEFVRRQNSKVAELSALQRNDRTFNGIDMQEIDNVKSDGLRVAGAGGNETIRAEVRVLSVNAYSRHKALIKRLEGVDGEWIRAHEPLLIALGLHTSSNPRARIVFCQSSFEYPLLLDHEYIRDELAPIFKGRPRKKVKRSGSNSGKTSNGCNISSDVRRSSARQKSKRKTYEMYNLEEYVPSKKSRLCARSKETLITRAKGGYDSATPSSRGKNTKSTSVTKKQTKLKKTERLPLKLIIKRDLNRENSTFHTLNREAVKHEERMSENSSSDPESSLQSSCSSSSNVSDDVSSPESNRGSPLTVDPATSPLGQSDDVDLLPLNENNFIPKLFTFMCRRNTPIGKIPSLGYKKLDLWEFFKLSQEYGGYEMVTIKRLWKHIYDRMGGNPSRTSAATSTRKHYEKFLLPFEKHINSLNQEGNFHENGNHPAKVNPASTENDQNVGSVKRDENKDVSTEATENQVDDFEENAISGTVNKNVQTVFNNGHKISEIRSSAAKDDSYSPEKMEVDKNEMMGTALKRSSTVTSCSDVKSHHHSLSEKSNSSPLRSSVIQQVTTLLSPKKRNAPNVRNFIPTRLYGPRYSSQPPPHIPRRDEKKKNTTDENSSKHSNNKWLLLSKRPEKNSAKPASDTTPPLEKLAKMKEGIPEAIYRPYLQPSGSHINDRGSSKTGSRPDAVERNDFLSQKRNEKTTHGAPMDTLSSNFRAKKNGHISQNIFSTSTSRMLQDVSGVQKRSSSVVEHSVKFPNATLDKAQRTANIFRSQERLSGIPKETLRYMPHVDRKDHGVFRMYGSNVPPRDPMPVPKYSPPKSYKGPSGMRPEERMPHVNSRPMHGGPLPDFSKLKPPGVFPHLNLGLSSQVKYPQGDPLTDFYRHLAESMRSYPHVFPGVPHNIGKEVKLNDYLGKRRSDPNT